MINECLSRGDPDARPTRKPKGKDLLLHQGKTKTGAPQYFFSMKAEGDLAEAIPEGYEIYENPNAQVFLRKIQPKLIWDSERAIVEKHLPGSPGRFYVRYQREDDHHL